MYVILFTDAVVSKEADTALTTALTVDFDANLSFTYPVMLLSLTPGPDAKKRSNSDVTTLMTTVGRERITWGVC